MSRHIHSRIYSFVWGLKTPWFALQTLFLNPILILWSSLPIVITLFIYALWMTHTQNYIELQLHALWIYLGIEMGGWIPFVLTWITRLILFIVSIVTFSFVSTIVACPLNDFLADKTESFTIPPLKRVRQQTIGHRLKGLMIDLVKSLLALSVYFSAILLSWVPVLNFFTLALIFFVTTFQYLSYPQTRRGQGVRDGITFLWQFRYCCLGFGTAFSLLFSVPFLSAFCQPLAVVGGTLLFARAQGSKTLPSLR